MSDPQPYVRCLVGFYPFLDIRQTKEHQASETAETLQKFSPIVQIADHPERVPPLFIARAGKDEIPTLLDSVDRFAAEALKRNVPVTVMNHPSGPHGFDNQLDDDRSREIVRGAVEFMKLHLGMGAAPAGSREEQETALVELERRRSHAIWDKNIQPLEGIYADDFRGLLADGSFVDKAGVFEMFKSHDPSLRFTIEELEARVLGQAAVTHGRITGRDPKGEIVILSKFTHVYVWRDGRWQIVEGVSLPLKRG
jgi:ketosteroid isomerase-like protein